MSGKPRWQNGFVSVAAKPRPSRRSASIIGKEASSPTEGSSKCNSGTPRDKNDSVRAWSRNITGSEVVTPRRDVVMAHNVVKGGGINQFTRAGDSIDELKKRRQK